MDDKLLEEGINSKLSVSMTKIDTFTKCNMFTECEQ